MNSWSFTGNLGRDCEQRFTAEGTSVVSFSVAVKAGFGDRATTTWVKCIMFGKQGAALVNYLNKGQQVGVVGEASNREWVDKEGAKRLSLEVRVENLTLLGNRADNSGQQQTRQPQQQQQAPQQAQQPVQQRNPYQAAGVADMDDDIPFAAKNSRNELAF